VCVCVCVCVLWQRLGTDGSSLPQYLMTPNPLYRVCVCVCVCVCLCVTLKNHVLLGKVIN